MGLLVFSLISSIKAEDNQWNQIERFDGIELAGADGLRPITLNSLSFAQPPRKESWLKRWKGVEGQARLFCWLVACGFQPPITPNKSTSLCPSHFSSFLSFWWRFSGPTKERLSWVGLPPRFGLVGAALHSFRKREVAALFPFIVSFHFTIQFKSCLLSSFIHLRSQTNHTLGCLSLFLASCLWRAAPITNKQEKTIGPAKTAIPRSIPKLMELIFMGSLCPLNHLYHLIQPMLSLPFNHLYCIKY